MKTKIVKRVKKAASALLTALIICSLFSLFVVYYLSLIEQQNLLNTRSQTWNMAISVTEAGVEEGLEHLNENTSNLALAPWSYIGGSTYYRSNTLPDGSSYTVFITNTLPNPVVVARAYVQMGTFLNMAKNFVPGFFATGGGSAAPTVVTRAVQVNCTKNSLYLASLVAKRNINLNGNNIATDSFDSCDTTKSVNGQYSAALSGDHGDIASNLGLVDSISGGNANIYGHAHTAPGPNTVSVGPNGGVGEHSWQASHHGLEDGWVLPDANFTFPDTTLPDTGGYNTAAGGILVVATYPPTVTSMTTSSYPVSGTYQGSVSTNKVHGTTYYTYNYITGTASTPTYATNTYDHILWGLTDPNDYSLGKTANYTASSLSGQTIVVGSNVKLVLPNGLSMSGNDAVTIVPYANVNVVGQAPNMAAPGGAGVVVYSGGTSCTIGGNGVINQPGLAADFILFCAPTVSSFTLNGNGGFTGVLVAPSVDLALNGGGNNVTDFIGCAMVNSATLNGHFHFHYDECLSRMKNSSRYLITAWNEIP